MIQLLPIIVKNLHSCRHIATVSLFYYYIHQQHAAAIHNCRRSSNALELFNIVQCNYMHVYMLIMHFPINYKQVTISSAVNQAHFPACYIKFIVGNKSATLVAYIYI